MKKIAFIFLIVIIGCSASKKISKKRDDIISNLVFRNYYEISEEGEQNADILTDSYIAQLQKETTVDSVNLEMLKQFSVSELFKVTPETEIHIELKQDTIWRYKTENGKIIGDLFRIDIEEETLYYHAKFDKSIMYNQFKIFQADGDYFIEEFPNDKKEILGYDCYKVIIRKKEQIDEVSPIRFGDTIYEMYVTKEIELSIHALLNFTKKFSGFFPLEVRTWDENLTGNQKVYEIKEIK